MQRRLFIAGAAQLGTNASTMTPAEATAFVPAESDRWRRVVETSGAKPA